MSKDFLRKMSRYTYFPALVLPVLSLVAAFLFGFVPSATLTVALMVFSSVALFFSVPTQWNAINWDKSLPSREPLFQLMGICVAPFAFSYARLGDATVYNANQTLSMLMFFMIFLIVTMISSQVFSWRVSRRYRTEYQAYRKAKAEEALAGQLESLIATLPVNYQAYVKAQLKDASPQKIAEVAQAFETLRESAPRVLDTK